MKNNNKKIEIGGLFIIIALVLIFLPIFSSKGQTYSLSQLNDICKGFYGQLAMMFNQDTANSCSIVQFGYYGLIIFGISGFVIILVTLIKK